MKPWPIFAVSAAITLLAISVQAAIEHPAGPHCVYSTVKGTGMNGESVWCTNGADFVDVRKMQIGIAGFTQETHEISITRDGDEHVYVIDLDKKTGTKTENPLYRDMLQEASQHDNPAGVWLKRMGYEATGRTDTVVGETVHEHRSQFGSVWLTDDYIMVKNEAMGAFLQEASRIERGTGGQYSYDPGSYGVEFQEIDINAIMQGRMPSQNRARQQPATGSSPADLSKALEALEALGLQDLQLPAGANTRNTSSQGRSNSASGNSAGNASSEMSGSAADSATDSVKDSASQ